MKREDRAALMGDIRNKYRAFVLTEDDLNDVQRKLGDYYRTGREEPGSLSDTAFRASDAIGFLRFDVMDALNEEAKLRKMVDALLAHCPIPECDECGQIVCPHGEPLHFHHDGCPACSIDDLPDHSPGLRGDN